MDGGKQCKLVVVKNKFLLKSPHLTIKYKNPTMSTSFRNYAPNFMKIFIFISE